MLTWPAVDSGRNDCTGSMVDRRPIGPARRAYVPDIRCRQSCALLSPRSACEANVLPVGMCEGLNISTIFLKTFYTSNSRR